MPEDRPDLTPAETERVRRLLAEARHTDPVPDDVAARLDRTLASLARERGEHQERAVTTLASRRRRNVVSLLVAAVAVVAVGIGLGQVVSETGGDGSNAGGASSADQESAPFPAESPADGGTPPKTDSSARTLPRLAQETFDGDVLALRERRTAVDGDPGSLGGGDGCERPAWGEGRRVPVRYDGAPAVLVFREPLDAVQPVDLFRCAADTPLRSTTVPAP